MDVKNKLDFGDNLKILSDYVASESVDRIYLDPPFNSSATYNVLFKGKRAARNPPPRSWPLRTPGNGAGSRKPSTGKSSRLTPAIRPPGFNFSLARIAVGFGES